MPDQRHERPLPGVRRQRRGRTQQRVRQSNRQLSIVSIWSPRRTEARQGAQLAQELRDKTDLHDSTSPTLPRCKGDSTHGDIVSTAFGSAVMAASLCCTSGATHYSGASRTRRHR